MRRLRVVDDFNAIAFGVWISYDADVVISLHVLWFVLELVIVEEP